MKIPFRCGDRVFHKRTKSEHIIYEVQIEATDTGFGAFYSTDKIAWLYHDDLTLIEESSEKSLRDLIEALGPEEFGGSDED